MTTVITNQALINGGGRQLARPALVGISTRPQVASVRLALLGVGNVGSAFLDRLGSSDLDIHLAYVSDSKRRVAPSGGIATSAAIGRLARSAAAADLGTVGAALGGPQHCRVVIDATASAAVAARHAHWLLRGIHVVTASKIANGGSQTDADAITAAAAVGGVTYGDSATVGAGLPLLRTLRALRAGGDEITRVRGVLSGSLAWLLNTCAAENGSARLSDLVRYAQRLGLTEPDPQIDLSGVDVHRKLLVLARAAGARINPADVGVEPLVPSSGSLIGPVADRWWADRYARATAVGHRLAYVATWEAEGQATVGLADLQADDPLVAGTGCDNRVAIWSSRYAEQPLVIQGPGAGAGVTAAAVLDDVRQVVADDLSRRR